MSPFSQANVLLQIMNTQLRTLEWIDKKVNDFESAREMSRA